MPLTSPTASFLPDLAHERATSPLFKASAFAFRSFPLLIRLPLAFAPLGNKRHLHLAPSTSRGEMGLGPQRSSESLAVAVATCAPRPPDVLSAGEGVVDVGAAAAAPCVKSLRSSSSNSYVVSHPAERALGRACKPCGNVGERPSRTSCSSYVVAKTGRIVSSKLSWMQLPTESAGATAEPVMLSDGKRHCGVGGRSGGRPPGASGAPGVVLLMGEFKFAP